MKTVWEVAMNLRPQCLAKLLVITLAGCASSGVVMTGPGRYMLSKTSAGGVFVSGNTVEADLYKEAGAFCAKQGMIVDTISAESANGIPFARMPNAEIHFRCVPAAQSAASAPS